MPKKAKPKVIEGEVAVIPVKETKQQKLSVTPTSTNIDGLVSMAVDKGLSVETIEKLLGVKERIDADLAKKAYVNAMTAFQRDCPVIKKNTVVKDRQGKERYRYAKLESIVTQVKKIIADAGLSYRFDEIKDEKYAAAVCIVTHEFGHSVQTAFKIEIGSEEFMTNTQKYGARMTFAKRYAFCNAFGILTGDDDNDAVDDVTDAELKKTPVASPQATQAPVVRANGVKSYPVTYPPVTPAKPVAPKPTVPVAEPMNFDQISIDLELSESMDELRKVWAKHYKTVAKFTEEERNKLELFKNELKDKFIRKQSTTKK